MYLRKGAQSAKEALHPRATGASGEHLCGQRKREEGGQRTGTHRCQVTESARQGAVSGGLGRMPVAAEVAAFEGEVSGDEDLVATRGAQDGAVGADAQHEAAGGPAIGGAWCHASCRTDTFDQRELA